MKDKKVKYNLEQVHQILEGHETNKKKFLDMVEAGKEAKRFVKIINHKSR